jgi:hypothetical protein
MAPFSIGKRPPRSTGPRSQRDRTALATPLNVGTSFQRSITQHSYSIAEHRDSIQLASRSTATPSHDTIARHSNKMAIT